MDVYNRQRCITTEEYGEVVFYSHTHTCGLDRGRHGPWKVSGHEKQRKSIKYIRKKKRVDSDGFTTLHFLVFGPEKCFLPTDKNTRNRTDATITKLRTIGAQQRCRCGDDDVE